MKYKDLIKIIEKPWIDINDIKIIADCGTYTATKIRREVENIVAESGKRLPTSYKKRVPTKVLLDYLDLNEDYIYHMAERVK